jgi:hypothetical protein
MAARQFGRDAFAVQIRLCIHDTRGDTIKIFAHANASSQGSLVTQVLSLDILPPGTSSLYYSNYFSPRILTVKYIHEALKVFIRSEVSALQRTSNSISSHHRSPAPPCVERPVKRLFGVL